MTDRLAINVGYESSTKAALLLRRKMSGLRDAARNRIVRAALKEGAAIVRKAQRRLAPTEYGILKRSIRVKVSTSRRKKNYTTATIGPGRRVQQHNRRPVRYAHLVEFGTKKHIIRPKKKKALAFSSVVRFTAAGKVSKSKRGRLAQVATRTLARFVRHPGTMRQPFIKPALERNAAVVRATIASRIRREIAKLIRKGAA